MVLSKQSSIATVKSSYQILEKDLAALPEDVFAKSMGGKARTVADIIFEINMVNDHIRMVIVGEKPFDWPDGGWITAPADFQSKDTVLAGLLASRDRFLDGLEAIPDDKFDDPIMSDEKETTRAERCRFVALHNWYHSGQLNFIQTLLGDDNWNW